MIDRDTLRQFDESFGTSMEDAGASGDDAPNGANFAGAINNLQRELEEIDELGLTYADLSKEKQTEIDEYIEDVRYHMKKLANLTVECIGNDDQLELPNGNTVDLSGTATETSGKSGDLPADPRSNNS